MFADHKAVNVYVNQRANISPTRLGAIFNQNFNILMRHWRLLVYGVKNAKF